MDIAICDDNPIDREIISMMLRDFSMQKSMHLDITKYSSGLALLDDIQDGRCFSIIFMDIYMEDILGIEAAYRLRNNLHYEGDLVFLTATSKFAVDSYEVDASGYMIKPLNYEKFYAVMDKIVSSYKVQTYPVRKHASIIHIPIDEILYIDSDNNKCTLHRKDGRLYTVYKKLDEIQEELPFSYFLRCHQSFLVNMDYIQRADKEFELITGDIVSIRQRDIKKIRSIYLSYISQQKGP